MAIQIVIGFILLVLFLGAVWYTVQIYNQLVSVEKRAEQAWSNIDVLLKQRDNELPKLVDTVQQYMDYEQETLQEVIEARSEAQSADDPKEQAEADGSLRSALGDLFALAEDYPELKANESFQQLQDRISSLEEQISDRRELYNEATTNYNTLINQIPYALVANRLNMSEKRLYEVDRSEISDPDIGDMFESTDQTEETVQR